MNLSEVHPALQPGNVAVVTGAASGIGLATASRMAEAGLTLCLVDRDQQALERVAEQLASRVDIRAECVDVSDREAVNRLGDTVEANLGPVSVLMNNAGVGGGGDALSNHEGWQRLIGVNLMGVLHGVQRFVPSMATSDRPGLVINTGSKQGITQPPGDTAYNVSKSGVKALTEGLAHTLRERTGNRVTAHLLIPGFTYTGMIARRVAHKPDGAWTPGQVADRLFEGLAHGEFYILCQDNETTRVEDERRILWAALDIIENRPALSRWHPEYREAFARFMSDGS